MEELKGILLLVLFSGMAYAEIYSINEDIYQPSGRNQGRNQGKARKCNTITAYCNPSDTYPSIDGKCNNLQHPTWGAFGSVIARLSPADYGDSRGTLRSGQYGVSLPSARKISNDLKVSNLENSQAISHMHVLWGQFVAHDFIHTPVVEKPDGTALDCNCQNPHRECINIQLPFNDEQYLAEKRLCMGLARSRPAVGIHNCQFPQREHVNHLTSYIDASMVYGKTLKESQELRDLSSRAGEMKTSPNPASSHHKLLPVQDEPQMQGTGIAKTIQCPLKVHKPVNRGCFVAGDVRNNENVGLASIQTVWVRYHNKIARELKNKNPHWSSDKTFNVVRRIMSAVIQIITYHHYLPPLLGKTWMKRFDLDLTREGFWKGYDPEYNPTVTHEFGTAAFRFGHSQVSTIMSRPGSSFQKGSVPDDTTRGSYFNDEALMSGTVGGVGAYMRGFMIDPASKTDGGFVDDLRNQLFTEHGKRYGNDLLAINIQRGRDHGITGYNKYREICGLSRALTFQDLYSEIEPKFVSILQSLYRSVDDIDLYVGGLLEKHEEGAEVGPTFACILAYQFRALKKGDRYWHENENSPSPFSLEQLKSLRSITYGRVLCDTGENMNFVSKNPFVAYSKGPQFVSCSSLPKFDLTPWDDRPSMYQFVQYKDESEWTRWFVTKETNQWAINAKTEEFRLKSFHKGAICDNVISHETRRVPYDMHTQIRFSCPAGTIGESDFPHQVSDSNQYSEWIVAKPIGYNAGYTVDVNSFRCQNVVGIQAMTTHGGKYALETSDVFEYYSTSHGFTCRNVHQTSNMCQRYKVRVLCSDDKKTGPIYVPAPTEKPYVPKPKPTPYSPYPPTYVPPSTTYSVPNSNVPSHIVNMAKEFCRTQGLCCEQPTLYYSADAPRYMLSFSRQWCEKYSICCDSYA